MPPFCVGAIRHSIVRTRSGMSKWTPWSRSIASSAVVCIQARSASVPRSVRAGSASRTATASATLAPDPAICSARADCSAVIRASSSTPHA